MLVREHFRQVLLAKGHDLQEVIVPVHLAPLDEMRHLHVPVVREGLKQRHQFQDLFFLGGLGCRFDGMVAFLFYDSLGSVVELKEEPEVVDLDYLDFAYLWNHAQLLEGDDVGHVLVKGFLLLEPAFELF